MPKRSLRKQLLAQRSMLSHEEWVSASNAAQAALIQLPEFQQAGCIAVYAPFRNETDTAHIVRNAFERGVRVLFPAVCGTEMVLRQVTSLEHLTEGAFGILEPCGNGVEHHADEADLIIVPGVAFDVRGHRIGYGKGYYDRFLHSATLRICLVGLCHDFQVTGDSLPAEDHDIRLDLIVTDKRIIRCGSNRSHVDGADLYTGGS